MGLPALKIEDLPHYNYYDYSKWEGKWELIKGIPYAMTPAPVIKHQRLNSKIDRYLGELLKKCEKCEALLPVDWVIEEDTVVQPDNLVVCSENKDIGNEPLRLHLCLFLKSFPPEPPERTGL